MGRTELAAFTSSSPPKPPSCRRNQCFPSHVLVIKDLMAAVGGVAWLGRAGRLGKGRIYLVFAYSLLRIFGIIMVGEIFMGGFQGRNKGRNFGPQDGLTGQHKRVLLVWATGLYTARPVFRHKRRRYLITCVSRKCWLVHMGFSSDFFFLFWLSLYFLSSLFEPGFLLCLVFFSFFSYSSYSTLLSMCFYKLEGTFFLLFSFFISPFLPTY